MLTVLGTVLAAPLLLVEIAPGINASPDAALTAFHRQLEEPEDAPPGLAGKAVGSLSSDDLTSTRLLSTFTAGDELRAEAAEEAAAAEEAEVAAAEAQAEIDAVREQERQAAEERLATTTTAPPPPPAPPAPAPDPAPPTGGPGPAQWAALRHCEAGGNYGAVNWSGPYYGAYQFLQSTWDSTATSAGRGDLVGVRPDQAAPANQDAMAFALYQRQGSSPWPICGRHLG